MLQGFLTGPCKVLNATKWVIQVKPWDRDVVVRAAVALH